jgi:hypothetical protein
MKKMPSVISELIHYSPIVAGKKFKSVSDVDNQFIPSVFI